MERNDEAKDAYFEAATALYKEALKWYSAKVNGGISVWFKKFFPEKGLYPLSKDACNRPDEEEKKE